MPNGPLDLSGLRILVIEDNLLLADVVCEALESYGCEVVGPYASAATGQRVAREAAIDCAVLDLRLDSGFSFPIAAALEKRGVPYLFLTAYADDRVIPLAFRHAQRLPKPIDPDGLATAISGLCRAPTTH